MKLRTTFSGMAVLALAMALHLPLSQACFAQGGANNPDTTMQKETQQNQDQQSKEHQLQGDQQTPPAPKLDPEEEAAYKAFFEANTADARIQLGTDFLAKYPMSRYDESVYAAVVQAYYAKQDWTNFYAVADKGLAAFPDDATMLTIVGWAIPHVFDPTAPDAAAKLAKAEKYEKHAIDVLGTLVKPVGLSDDLFAKSKAMALSEAHSGLGLVYFRQEKWSDSVSELQQATQAAAEPDQTDFYVLGLDFDRQGKYPEAVDAYTKCSQAMGGLSDRCKQSADKDKAQAAQPK